MDLVLGSAQRARCKHQKPNAENPQLRIFVGSAALQALDARAARFETGRFKPSLPRFFCDRYTANFMVSVYGTFGL